jgi:hypothetical protein
MAGSSPQTCCATLGYYLERACQIHDDPWDCPDRLFYRASDGEIGIVVHDGGSSFVTMRYCPFCGQEQVTAFDAEDLADIMADGDPFRRIDLGALDDDS